jgi:hypothetical protein
VAKRNAEGLRLVIDLLGTKDQITVFQLVRRQCWCSGAKHHAGGETLLNAQVQKLVSAMASFVAGNSGFNPTTATTMPGNATLQSVIAANWQKHA